jgi:tRNA pseudouridine65 synthase
VAILANGPTAIAVDKPSGMLVHNDAFAGPRERSLRQELGQQLGRRVFPVHRLDRGTSGVALFAHEREHVAAWQAALAAEASVKTYIGLCRGRLEGTHDIQRPVKDPDGDARPARSLVIGIAHAPSPRCSIFAARIFTGRHHQIRRHLAGMSHPVVGDTTHGNSRFNREFDALRPLGRLALHAFHLDVRSDLGAISVTAPLTGTLHSAIEALFGPDVGEQLASATKTFASSS